MRKFLLFTLTACMVFIQLAAGPGYACVGRVLTLAIDGSTEQKLVGTLLATYITERTGTTVELKTVTDLSAAEQLLRDGEADITLDYLGHGLQAIEGAVAENNPQKEYGLVKHYYMDKYEMVWLKPLGYTGPLAGGAKPSLAVPVTTREVLNRFPVLDRVINKLGGRLEQNTVTRLLEQTGEKDLHAIAKLFLKERNLI